MDPSIVIGAIAVIALIIGVVVGLAVSRSGVAAAAKAAAAEADSSSQTQIATLTERVASAARELESERAERQSFQSKAEGWRSSLDSASNDIARLEERASRVGPLEARVEALAAEAQLSEVEKRNLATTSGQNAERATLLNSQLEETTAAMAAVQGRLDAATIALQRANEARAGFEQQAQRVLPLETELAAARTAFDAAKDELTQLRESSSGEVARLNAELVAEREAFAVVREAVATAKAEKDTLEAKAIALADELSVLKETSGKETSRLSAELAGTKDTLAASRLEASTLRTGKEEADARGNQLTDELTLLRTRSEADRVHAEEKLVMLNEAKEALSNQFKTLANEILEEKSKRFTEQNQTSMGQLLDPLRTQLSEFKGKVEEVYIQEGKDRTALQEQVRQLMSLNNTLSQDAKNLTNALKGQAKVQGNWGEHILETVLEASGLKKGIHYKVQETQVREDGSRAIPDVVIELPEGRKLVVDAKVSLVAYERYVSAEDEAERKIALKLHLESVQNHIKGLSDKRYEQLYAGQSLDFVLAFVPIEPAFMMAVTTDSDMFMKAYERNVLMVSPSTLLFVVKTVAHLWRQEAQSKNAQEIAKRGALLFEKMQGFVLDLNEVGKRLTQAKSVFDDAQSKLSTGPGNVIRQAQMLIDLGVKSSKALPPEMIEKAISSDGADTPAISTLTALAMNDTQSGINVPPAG